MLTDCSDEDVEPDSDEDYEENSDNYNNKQGNWQNKSARTLEYYITSLSTCS